MSGTYPLSIYSKIQKVQIHPNPIRKLEAKTVPNWSVVEVLARQLESTKHSILKQPALMTFAVLQLVTPAVAGQLSCARVAPTRETVPRRLFQKGNRKNIQKRSKGPRKRLNKEKRWHGVT